MTYAIQSNVPQYITGVTHPLISEIYMKKDYAHDHQENVLVIKTHSLDQAAQGAESEAFSDILIDLLSDLEDIKTYAEERVGSFDRVDIRAH